MMIERDYKLAGKIVKAFINPFPKGNPDDPKSEAFRVLYELQKKLGDKRFLTDCKHEVVKYGVCANCLRKVI